MRDTGVIFSPPSGQLLATLCMFFAESFLSTGGHRFVFVETFDPPGGTCLRTTKLFDKSFFSGVPSGAVDADLFTGRMLNKRIGIGASVHVIDAAAGG
jgi:hypothetical protein